MFEDALRCNAIVAAITIFQLTFDKFRFIKGFKNSKVRFLVTYSEKDRVIPIENTKKLVNDLICPIVIKYKNIGHTVALEAKDEYYQMIINLANRGV